MVNRMVALEVREFLSRNLEPHQIARCLKLELAEVHSIIQKLSKI